MSKRNQRDEYESIRRERVSQPAAGVTEVTRLAEGTGLAAGVVVDRAGAAAKEKREKRKQENGSQMS